MMTFLYILASVIFIITIILIYGLIKIVDKFNELEQDFYEGYNENFYEHYGIKKRITELELELEHKTKSNDKKESGKKSTTKKV